MPKCDFNKCRNVISVKLLCNFIEIAFRHGCSPVNLLLIFRTPLPKNTSGGLLLYVTRSIEFLFTHFGSMTWLNMFVFV